MKNKLNCVLLVDDNESDNFLHKRVLEKSGICEVVAVALNGREALDYLINAGEEENSDGKTKTPELVLLDINMPVMDGWEFLEEFNNLEEVKKRKVVITMLTTSINPADKLKAGKLIGSSCFHYKPLTMEMINMIMKNHFAEYL